MSEPERWYQTLLDDPAGRKQWMQAAGNILARTDGKTFYLWHNAPIPNATNHYTYVAESLRSKTAPSVADLLGKRALEIAPTTYTSSEDCWAFDNAADLGLMLDEWDTRNAGSALKKIMQRGPAPFYDQRETWNSFCNDVLTPFARLAVALANLGDNTGLDLYSKCVKDRAASDLRRLPMALLPLARFPNYPSIKEASERLFRTGNGDWIEAQSGYDLLNTRLPLNRPFRELILNSLTNRTKAGTFVFKGKNQFNIAFDRGGEEGGILQPDVFAPRIGQTVSFRVCDDVARRLSRIEGVPVLRLFWPEDRRDETVASIVRFLQDNGDNLKLKPAAWPASNDD
jgi:hypothetical protein